MLYLAIKRWNKEWPLEGRDILHIAQEPQIGAILQKLARQYLRGDIEPRDCDLALDLYRLPFPDASFDLVIASHVLEHIVEDSIAPAEIYRVLRPGGVAIPIVPITAKQTRDWRYQDPARNRHTRECGPDYFDRYRKAGFKVTLYRTDDFSEVEHYALASWRDGRRTVHWVPFLQKV